MAAAPPSAVTPPQQVQLNLPAAQTTIQNNPFFRSAGTYGQAGNIFSPELAAAQTAALGNQGAAAINAAGSLANTQQQGAYGLANTLQAALGQYANTGLQGQQALQQIAAQGPWTLANTGLSGQYGLAEAQTTSLPNLLSQARQTEAFNALFPYATGILSQISPLLSNISGSVFGGGFNPSTGQLTTPQGVSATPVSVPTSAISPGQAAGMLGANTTQGNMAAANQAAALGLGQDPLGSQLAQQLAAGNSGNLARAATGFEQALAPANAQQILGASQLGELQRNALAMQQLQYAGLPIQRLQGLEPFITGVMRGAMGGGGL